MIRFADFEFRNTRIMRNTLTSLIIFSSRTPGESEIKSEQLRVKQRKRDRQTERARARARKREREREERERMRDREGEGRKGRSVYKKNTSAKKCARTSEDDDERVTTIPRVIEVALSDASQKSAPLHFDAINAIIEITFENACLFHARKNCSTAPACVFVCMWVRARSSVLRACVLVRLQRQTRLQSLGG